MLASRCVAAVPVAASALARLGARGLASTASPLVVVEAADDDGIAVVRMARGPVNSLNTALVRELTDAIKRTEADSSVKGIVLASNERAFSAGVDLSEVHNVSEASFQRFWGDFETMWRTLYISPLATVAAVENHAIAGGSVLALACDYRVVADNPKLRLGLNETQLGMVAPRWLQAMTTQTVGPRHAEYLLQTGAFLSPDKALLVGFVDEVSNQDEVLSRARDMCVQFAKQPPKARAETKRQQREHIADMAGPNSASELWAFMSSEECSKSIQATLDGLKKNKK